MAFFNKNSFDTEELDIYEEESRGGRWLRTWLLVMLVLIILVCMSLRITDIRVIGNTTYTEEEARDLVFDSAYELNPIYCFVRNTFFEHKELPFVEDYDIRFRSPFSCDLIIYEKRIVGYLDYMSSYMYFDRDGIVVENSTEKLEGIPEITGLSFGHIVLNTYGIESNEIHFDSSGVTIRLSGAAIDVRLGSEDEIDAKILALSDMLPQILERGLEGTLDLSSYSEAEDSNEVSFRIREENKEPEESEAEKAE